MKQRMITVVFGITLLLIILLFYKTILLNIGIAVVAVLAVQEICSAEKITDAKGLMGICFVFAAFLPFLDYIGYKETVFLAFFAFLLALFIYMLYSHDRVKLGQMAVAFMMTLLATASLSCIVFMRDYFAAGPRDEALFYIALVFISAWVTDGGGYIFGRLFGKHKLSPTISPKKTVEGAVGGVVLAVPACAAALWGYGGYLSLFGQHALYNYGSVIVLALFCAAVSIVGDLCASLLKRENGIKDFGRILPGHGGVMDRFDSILFVAPLILLWARNFPIVSQ